MKTDIQEGEVWPYGLNWGWNISVRVPTEDDLVYWVMDVIKGGREPPPEKVTKRSPYISLKFVVPFMRDKMLQSFMRNAECLHCPVFHIGRICKKWRWNFFWLEVENTVDD